MQTTTARTDDRPVEKLAQCKLMKLNPLFDWSSVTSADSLLTLFVTDKSASSWNSIDGAGVVVVVEVLCYSAIRLSCFLIFSWMGWVDPIIEEHKWRKNAESKC